MEKRKDMPKNILKADPSKLNYCRHCNEKITHYEDKQFKCKACGKQTTFTAKEQKNGMKFFSSISILSLMNVIIVELN